MNTHTEPQVNPSRVLTREMDEAVHECVQCHRVSMGTFSHFLTLESDAPLADLDDLRLLLDCADICSIAADFLMRVSEFHLPMCSLCSDICRRCYEMCSRVASDGNPITLECAEACVRCANACKRVLATSAAA